MRKVVLTFGLIGGGMLAAMMLLTLPFMEQIGFDRGMVVGYTTMVLAFLMVYFGVRSYRDQVAGGRITFGRAFRVGALISLVTMTCYVATWQVMYHTFMPDFTDKYAAHALDKARAGGATDAELAATKAEMDKFAEMYKNPLVNIGFTFLEPLPVALLVTLVSAGLLSRSRGSPDPAVA
jgi:hypothetical protein